jgi:glycosyltransferase involved in cell wall biosynthesis
MTKVLLWHWNRKGGGPRYTWELAKALIARGEVEVTVSFSRQSEFAEEMRTLGVPSLEVETYTDTRGYLLGLARLPRLRRRMAEFVRSQEVDVVVSTMNHMWSPFVAPAVRRAGVPYVLVAHDAETHPGEGGRLQRRILRRDIALADALIAPTRHVGRRLLELRPELTTERLAVIPLGSFAFAPEPSPPRALPDNGPVELLFFGRLMAYKGIDILAEAYRLLRRRYGTRVRLTVAGAGEEEIYAPLLRDLPGATWDNRWIPESEIGAILARAHVLLLPYREASQSGSLAAAEYAALPSAATPVGGLAEEIADYGSGVVAQAVTARAFADAVMRLIDRPERYAACSEAARATALGPKSWDTIAAEMAGFLEGLAAR